MSIMQKRNIRNFNEKTEMFCESIKIAQHVSERGLATVKIFNDKGK